MALIINWSYSVKGKELTRFIQPKDVDKVTEYVNEYNRIKGLLSDLSEAYVTNFKDHGWDYEPAN